MLGFNQLSNLYWSIGCMDSAIILFDIVDYLFKLKNNQTYINHFFMFGNINQFSWIKKYDDINCPYPIALLETAIENLYIARQLADFQQSMDIANQITQGKGLFTGFEGRFNSYEDLHKLVKKKLNSLNVPLADSFCRKAFEHSEKLISQYFPDYVAPHELRM